MLGMNFKVILDPIPEILARRHLEEGGEVQRYIDSECLRLSEPYTPFLTGTLSHSGIGSSDIGSGEIQWSTPYARYQYYGKVMVGRAPKTVTNIPLTYHGGGARGEKWFERMKAAHKGDILNGAAAIAGGKAS